MGRDVCEDRPSSYSRSSNAMKPLTFNGTDVDVKTFLDKFKAFVKENRWIDEQKLVQLQNQHSEPTSVILRNLEKDGSTVTFDHVCTALVKILWCSDP